MRSVSFYDAKSRLSALIHVVERGEEVVITNDNRPVARLAGVTAPRERPVFGPAKAAFQRSGLTEGTSPRRWRR
jgi:prevent-host-death family protein